MSGKIVEFTGRQGANQRQRQDRQKVSNLTRKVGLLLAEEGYSLDECIALLMPLVFRPGSPSMETWIKNIDNYFGFSVGKNRTTEP